MQLHSNLIASQLVPDSGTINMLSRAASVGVQMSRLSLATFLLALLLLGAESVDYNVFIDKQLVQESCDSKEDKGNVPISELLDSSGLTHVLDNDYETLYISGDIIVKKELPRGPIKFEADLSRWERGEWVQTFVSLKRDDFCKSLEDPSELWYLFVVTQIPEQQRTCPPKPGQVYNLVNVTNRMLVENLPRWDIEGDIKAVVHFSIGDFKSCMLVHCSISIL